MEQVPDKGDTVIVLGLVPPFSDDVPAIVITPQDKDDCLVVTVIGCFENIRITKENCRF